MRKKLVCTLLTLMMTAALAGCGTKDSQTGTADTNDTLATEETVTDDADDTETTEDAVLDEEFGGYGEDADADAEDAADASGDTAQTVGHILEARFEAICSEDSSLSAEEIAGRLMSDESIPFSPMVIGVEEGLLTGFGETEITGFTEGAMFSPMIGSIPFVGYLFTLEEDADTDAFLELLESSADLRWNICTEADEMVTGSYGTKVFFLMSPKSFDEEEDSTEAYDSYNLEDDSGIQNSDMTTAADSE